MSEQEFREIQLSGKQLIFFFMAAVVLSVVIFLLGVSVGRGVATPAEGTSVEVTPDRPAPPSPVAAGEKDALPPSAPGLQYQSTLQNQTPATPENTPAPPAQPAPAPARNPSTGEVAPITPTITPAPAGAKPPAPEATSKPTPQAAAPAPAAPDRGGWDVQVGAFNSKANADALVAELKRKGHAAFTTPGGRGQPAHIVRVGPFRTRAEADRAQNVLEPLLEGRTKPSVISR